MNIRWMAKNLKNRIVLSAGIVSYMLLLLMRIPLSRVIGDAGAGLFAPAFELFILTNLVVSYGMSSAMSGIIRYRVKRERYRNAGKVFQTAFAMNLVMGTVAALFLLFFSSWIAETLVLEELSRMAVMASAPAVFFAAVTGTFRGYFNGYGMGVLTAHSQYIEKIAMFAGALICGRAFYGYGQKVAALRQVEAHSYAYGALGAMLGVFISQVIALLHLLLVYVIYAGAFKGRPGQDNSRRAESRFEIQRMIVVNMVPFAAVAVLSNLFMIADQRYLNYCMNVTENGAARTTGWGCYYGKFAPLLGSCAAVCCLFVHGMTGKIANAYEREEYRNMRERMGRAIRNASMVSFPAAIYLAVLGKPLSVCCYGRVTAQSAVLAGWIAKGAVVAVLFTFCFLFGQILYKMRMLRELFLAAAASFAVHLAAAYFMTQRGHMGVEGLLCALILFFGVYMVLAFVFLNRRVKYQPDWFGGILFPLAAAAVSGLVVYLLNMLLSGFAGAAVCMIVCLPVGVFFHIFFLVILRVIGEGELQEMPFGFLFIMLGRTIGVL